MSRVIGSKMSGISQGMTPETMFSWVFGGTAAWWELPRQMTAGRSRHWYLSVFRIIVCLTQLLGSFKQLFRLRPAVSAALSAHLLHWEWRQHSDTDMGHSHWQGEVLFVVDSTTDETSCPLYFTLSATVSWRNRCRFRWSVCSRWYQSARC